MKTKRCSKCGKIKSLSEFFSDTTKIDNKSSACKKCLLIQQKEYYLKNKKYYKEYSKNYMPKYRKNNLSKIRKISKKYYENHLKFCRGLMQKYRKKHSLRHNLSERIRKALRGVCASKDTIELLGCSIDKLKKHLETQFKPRMSWKNYGKWHVDHKIPCTSFDLTKESERYKCFNYKNLQPLWAKENISKGGR